jgi:aryl-alcohol dehydrogenase-like predicted oxidoreductase
MEHRYLGGSGFRVPVLSFGTATFGGKGEFFKAWGTTDVKGATRLVDAMTPIEETLSALDDLVRAGKIRYVGCSNFSGWHLMKSSAIADRHNLPRYVAHQAHYSLVTRAFAWELMPLGLDQKVGTMVWSPLASGRLTGQIRRDQPLPASSRLHKMTDQPWVENDYFYRVLDTLYAIVEETGKSVPQIALNWLLQKPTVSSIIVGARDEAQLRENLGAIGWNLTPTQVAKLDSVSERTPAYPYWHQRGFVERNPSPVAPTVPIDEVNKSEGVLDA